VQGLLASSQTSDTLKGWLIPCPTILGSTSQKKELKNNSDATKDQKEKEAESRDVLLDRIRVWICCRQYLERTSLYDDFLGCLYH